MITLALIALAFAVPQAIHRFWLATWTDTWTDEHWRQIRH